MMPTARGEFVAALFEMCDGLVELRALPSKATAFLHREDHEALERFITSHKGENVYIGAATRKDATSGTLENSCHLSVLFADIDFKSIPETEARQRLKKFPLPPSAVVRTGGGLHVYWFLREPMILPDFAAVAKSLLRRLAHVLGADLAAAEPARVLRLPGTLNHKYQPARLVTLETLATFPAYNPSEFDEILPPEPTTNGHSAPFTMPDEPLAEGEGRNNALYRVVRSMRSKNMSAKAIMAAAEAENARFKPPLPDDELQTLIRHALTQPDRHDFAAHRSKGHEPAPAVAIPVAVAPPLAPAERPVIDATNLGLDEMAQAAWKAIEAANTPPKIYLYAGALAWLPDDTEGRPHIEVMRLEHVRHLLADVATFVRPTGGSRGKPTEMKPTFPPMPLAADLLAVPHRSLPILRRLVRVPVFTASGRLITARGYDAESGLYFDPPSGLVVPAIAETPTAEDIYSAGSEIIDELLIDFPFLTQADRAHAVALVLTPILRELIPDNVPLFVISKPTPRTGATLLVKAVSLLLTGTAAPATTVSRDEEEMRKRLTSFLLPSPTLLLLDNLHGRLNSAALAAILTAGEWQDRPLGVTKNIVLPVRSVFCLTGNNVVLSSELAGRSVMIRLDPKVEDPSTRADFRHPLLESWTLQNRGRLLWAALTLVQAWLKKGAPHAQVTFGGFQGWADVLGGVLDVAGIEGFLQNREDLFRRSDEEGASIRGFLAAWWAQHQAAPVMVKSLLEIARDHTLEISAKTEQGTLVRLGRLVQSLEDRQYNLGNGLTVAVRRGGLHQRAVLWALAAVSL